MKPGNRNAATDKYFLEIYDKNFRFLYRHENGISQSVWDRVAPIEIYICGREKKKVALRLTLLTITNYIIFEKHSFYWKHIFHGKQIAMAKKLYGREELYNLFC